MSGDVDYYAVLRVAKSADQANIRAAYRTLAKRYHPDVAVGNRDQATEVFHLITQAYETLCDVSRRAQYDARRQLTDPKANAGQGHRHGEVADSARSVNRWRDSATVDRGFARARKAANNRRAGLRSTSRSAFIWLGGLVVIVTAVLFLAEILKLVVANRASAPTVEPTTHAATPTALPPTLLAPGLADATTKDSRREAALSGRMRGIEKAMPQWHASPSSRAPALHRNGEPRIAYNSKLLAPATVRPPAVARPTAAAPAGR